MNVKNAKGEVKALGVGVKAVEFKLESMMW